jgi:hypothetical protein
MTKQRMAELRATRWHSSGTSAYARTIEECLTEIELLQARLAYNESQTNTTIGQPPRNQNASEGKLDQ